MSNPQGTPSDRWADWLLRGRQRGMNQQQVRRLQSGLDRLRNRILSGARLRRGQTALDVGAGTGLLALEARRRVGASGQVVALDLSQHALVESIRGIGEEEAVAPLSAVRGDALHLPFAAASFDAVMTRSVLIYVADKASAIQELYRVLRPGGRASIFEPVNRANQHLAGSSTIDWSVLQPAHGQVLAYRQRGTEQNETMVDFDERDLLRWFIEAGFSSVQLIYRHTYVRRRRRRDEIVMSLQQRPNPSMISHEEAAQRVLGEASSEYLERYVRLLLEKPSITAGAGASVTAER